MTLSNYIKALTKKLRQALKKRDIDLTHGQGIEIISELIGEASWNHLSAKLKLNTKQDEMPYGWFPFGEELNACYHLTFDRANHTLSIACKTPRPRAFATLMQHFWADHVCHKSLCFKAQIKTEAAGNASIWMRADAADRQRLAFDNMRNAWPDRSLTGTADWQDVSIEMELPQQTAKVYFGLLLSGKGKASFRNLQISTKEGELFPQDYQDTNGLYPVNLGLFANQTK